MKTNWANLPGDETVLSRNQATPNTVLVAQNYSGSSHLAVYDGAESASFEERSGDVVGEVAKAQSGAAEVFEPAVDRFGGAALEVPGRSK